ncbi:MAG TPA: argininosuccinate lyase, partial [bacterium (Candidatus Stahlbacteria)]|nr:argininosuccinate lyase [Candidatus Stahlbacteria bacterium]
MVSLWVNRLFRSRGIEMANKKVWKGRFKKDSNEDMEQFSHSIDIDQRLWSDDLKVNLAWAEALREIRIITDQEFVEIRNGLERIRTEFEKGEFRFHPQDEDIHTATERRLTEITPAGAKIHTGRSRNDQVMTDLFLYLKREIDEISILIRDLMEVIVNRAEENIDLIMPGYTHLMPAQPILFAHYLLSLFWFLKRTIDRLGQAQERCNIMPLGSGAISGSGFPIDRKLLANRLCFKHLSQNSLDITSHRDIPIETGSILVMVMVVLSRYSSDLILFSNPNFGLFTIDEAFATGSSMMPQKRNPDSLELIRGQAATTIGRLAGLYTLCHGLPHGYNRDLQED